MSNPLREINRRSLAAVVVPVGMKADYDVKITGGKLVIRLKKVAPKG